MISGSGEQLPAKVRAEAERSLGGDFSGVQVHSGRPAVQAARDLGARAFTVGRNIVGEQQQLDSGTPEGARVLRHELVHVAQQRDAAWQPGAALPILDRAHPTESQANSPHAGQLTRLAEPAIQCERTYTAAEIAAMRAGTATGSASDNKQATDLGMVPGDLVFRLGSRPLAMLIDNPVTHGGIYRGGGVIHDMVGIGNRTATLTDFLDESADPSVVKIVRFTGPRSDLILRRLLRNIAAMDFRLPTDPKPWNLFSSGGDYRTANCLEYAHAQFLYAIAQLQRDPAVDAATMAELTAVYFQPGAAFPSDLARPQEFTQSQPLGHPSLFAMMMAAADSQGKNIDNTVFENRWEGRTTSRDFGPPQGSWARWILPPNIVETDRLESFTYRSFADSRRFFTVIR